MRKVNRFINYKEEGGGATLLTNVLIPSVWSQIYYKLPFIKLVFNA